MRDQHVHAPRYRRPFCPYPFSIVTESPARELWYPRRAVEAAAFVLDRGVLEINGIIKYLRRPTRSTLDLEVVIAADAQHEPESLPREPVVEAHDVVRVSSESVATIAAVDQHIAFQSAELLVQTVRVADGDESHWVLEGKRLACFRGRAHASAVARMSAPMYRRLNQ